MIDIENLKKKLELLRMEYDFEKKEYERQTELMGVGRKVKRGMCWHPVGIGRCYHNSLGKLVMEVVRTEDFEIEHHFEYGRPVVFFFESPNGSVRYLNFRAEVSYVDGDRMVLVMPSMEAVELVRGETGHLGVQLFFDETTYKLMFEALGRVIGARDGRLAELRDAIYGLKPVGISSTAGPSMPWLNKSQEKAVGLISRAKDVAVVHGPPGTGKTTTLVEAVVETLLRENQVMVAAQSNMVVDWISEKLVDRGISVVRIGNPVKVNDKMLSYTYERRYEGHPDYPELWAARRRMGQLRSAGKRRGGEMDKLREFVTRLEVKIDREVLDGAKVIACTLAGSAQRILEGRRFHTLFIDEAAQALEPACWIAAAKADRIVLAGDHCQLPPVIKCREAARGGLGRTLMEEVVERHPEAVGLLTMQYRMNEEIMRFSSDYFYNGLLTAAPDVKYRGILDFDRPMEWIDTEVEDDGGEQFVGTSYGRINIREADLTVEVLKNYIKRIGLGRILEENIDFGIISPYKAQVQQLRRRILKDKDLFELRDNISINTVDGFQGQERDVVIISMVRSNDKGEIGFLGDLRRMNVAITRARMKLIIIGDAATLGRHRFYKSLFDSCRRNEV